jgi:shikimate dehydrogenase
LHQVGLIGAGIGASLSPALHEREAAELGLEYRYTLLEIAGRDLGALLEECRRAGYSGLNVTHPCKQAVVAHLGRLSPDAAALRAVNTVVFDGLSGHNTDTTGFAENVQRGLPDASLAHVVLLGAGGAGTAVALALLRLGAERLTVVDVEPERAASCVQRLGDARAVSGSLDALADADGLVHATPTGMEGHGAALPLDEALLHPDLWVSDIVYRPLDTPLLRVARELGCRTLDGGGMAVFQAAGSFELFTGIEPDRERMLRHFAELTGAPVG